MRRAYFADRLKIPHRISRYCVLLPTSACPKTHMYYRLPARGRTGLARTRGHCQKLSVEGRWRDPMQSRIPAEPAWSALKPEDRPACCGAGELHEGRSAGSEKTSESKRG